MAWDLRRTMPYLAYDEVDFDVIIGTYGDNFDRYAIRINEIRESVRILWQVLDKMPTGDYRVQDKKVTPPPRARIDESMEALIHHFKIFTEGFKVPEGEVYVAIESPRGELGCYMVSERDVEAVPDAHPGAVVREPPEPPGHDARGARRRRRGHHLVGRPRHGRGGPVTAAAGAGHLSPDIVARARELIELYPHPRSALIPICHLAQEQDGWLRPEAIDEIADLGGPDAGRGPRDGLVLRDAPHRRRWGPT